MSCGLKWLYQQSLAPFSSLKIGGPAKLFLEVREEKTLLAALSFARERGIPIWILGRGSNSLFDDRGFDGLVILNRMRMRRFEQKNGLLTLGSGYNLSLIGTQMSLKGWSGLEFAAAIPGSVGGAVFMNAGAHGSEMQDILTSVCYVDQEGREHRKRREELHFAYRYSSFHETSCVIVTATFQLARARGALQEHKAVLKRRVDTQPSHLASAGCVFHNPSDSKKSAGALIEACGLKGTRVGALVVSPLHANFILNEGGGTAADFMQLVTLIQERVLRRTGIHLKMEICVVPYHGHADG